MIILLATSPSLFQRGTGKLIFKPTSEAQRKESCERAGQGNVAIVKKATFLGCVISRSWKSYFSHKTYSFSFGLS